MSATHLVIGEGRHALELPVPAIMGVLNVTPDSFSDGGRYLNGDAALRRAEQMLGEGADLIDVGGESTRPGARPVSEAEELERVLPVIERIAANLDVPVSVDTSRPAVMTAACDAGAALINDVRALSLEGAVAAAVAAARPVCLMHIQGQPATMQDAPSYADAVTEVIDHLRERARVCERAGLSPASIVLDPGIGFGKRLEDNLALIVRLPALLQLGYPTLIGVSRKSMLGQLTGKAVDERLAASVTLAFFAAQRGAHILRVHDVGATADARKLLWALRSADTLDGGSG